MNTPLVFSQAASTTAGSSTPRLRSGPAQAAGEQRPTFIITLRDGEPRAVAAEHSRRYGADVEFVYEHALRGYAAQISESRIGELSRDRRVERIERDQAVYASETVQQNPTWGLDRIDDRAGLDKSYGYAATGKGVTAYIIDTGIRTTHADFGGQAQFGFDAIDGGYTSDCNGHGTHVAGTVGGTAYGVAKDVTLVGVRVLDCSGSGTVSGVVAGIDYVTRTATGPAVANMSLGGGASTALDDAVSASIDAGIPYAVAAGNGNRGGKEQDACGYSPARVPAAMTIGATSQSDTKTSWSNYGDCVDWFAPGYQITSAWYTTDSATATISGTSMSSPHTAGVAAQFLETTPGATAQQVSDHLYDLTTKGIVSSSRTTNNHLLYTDFVPAEPAGLSVTGVTADPSVLNADATGTTISFTLSEAADWTATVAGATTVCTKTGTGTGTAAGTQSFVWDGTNATGCSGTGTAVADGTYTVKIDASTATDTATAGTSVVVDRSAPVIGNVAPTGTLTTSNSATVTWTTTGEAADSVVEYSTTDGFTSGTRVESPDLVESHAIDLSGLAAETTYYYEVSSTDAAANTTTSGQQSFTTAAASTAVPTVVGLTYSTDGGRWGDQHLTLVVTVGDGSGGVVAGQTVVGTIDHHSGSQMSFSGTTGSDGTLAVKWTNAPHGCYSTTITQPGMADGVVTTYAKGDGC